MRFLNLNFSPIGMEGGQELGLISYVSFTLAQSACKTHRFNCSIHNRIG